MSSSSDRIAKAWRVRPIWSDDDDIVYAETAGKARYQLKLDLDDPDLTFQEIAVRRAKQHDKRLPAPHRLVAELSENERHIILHAFGADARINPGCRNHYCAHAGDGTLLRLAWELGLFSGPYGEQPYGGSLPWSGVFFYLTELGRHVALSMMPTYR